jgi:hypothetical protein
MAEPTLRAAQVLPRGWLNGFNQVKKMILLARSPANDRMIMGDSSADDPKFSMSGGTVR